MPIEDPINDKGNLGTNFWLAKSLFLLRLKHSLLEGLGRLSRSNLETSSRN